MKVFKLTKLKMKRQSNNTQYNILKLKGKKGLKEMRKKR